MTDDYTLLTPENVELRFDVAGVGSRLAAAAIDYLILGLAIAVLELGGSFLFSFLAGALGLVIDPDRFYRIMIFGGAALTIILTFFLWWGYFVLFELLWNGQSPGKRWVGLRVVRQDGQPVSLGASLLRNVIRVVDVGLMIGPIVMVVDRRGRRLGDFPAGTLVTREPRGFGRGIAAALKPLDVPPVLSDAVSSLSNVERLGSADYAVLRAYFARRPSLSPDAAARLATRLASELARRLDLPEPYPGGDSVLFLAAALRAYEARQTFAVERDE